MPSKLSEDELQDRLQDLHGDWQIREGKLEREWSFPDFKTAFGMVSGVARLAEGMDHHPDIELGWGRVKLSLFTHSEHGLTNNDFNLAHQIDELSAHLVK